MSLDLERCRTASHLRIPYSFRPNPFTNRGSIAVTREQKLLKHVSRPHVRNASLARRHPISNYTNRCLCHRHRYNSTVSDGRPHPSSFFGRPRLRTSTRKQAAAFERYSTVLPRGHPRKLDEKTRLSTYKKIYRDAPPPHYTRNLQDRHAG